MPFIRPFRITNILFTYLIPIIPIFVLWDGIVSLLRTYTADVLRKMTQEIDANDYEWEIKASDSFNGVNYLLDHLKIQSPR